MDNSPNNHTKRPDEQLIDAINYAVRRNNQEIHSVRQVCYNLAKDKFKNLKTPQDIIISIISLYGTYMGEGSLFFKFFAAVQIFNLMQYYKTEAGAIGFENIDTLPLENNARFVSKSVLTIQSISRLPFLIIFAGWAINSGLAEIIGQVSNNITFTFIMMNAIFSMPVASCLFQNQGELFKGIEEIDNFNEAVFHCYILSMLMPFLTYVCATLLIDNSKFNNILMGLALITRCLGIFILRNKFYENTALIVENGNNNYISAPKPPSSNILCDALKACAFIIPMVVYKDLCEMYIGSLFESFISGMVYSTATCLTFGFTSHVLSPTCHMISIPPNPAIANFMPANNNGNHPVHIY